MLIEIRNVAFVNKGAELMLRAVVEQVRGVLPDARLAMVTGTRPTTAPYIKRAALGLYQKPWLWKYGVQWGGLAALAPARVRALYGVVLDREVDVVLDASGFFYSDQFGVEPIEELANSVRRWRRRGTKVILLPQAFGPFTKPAAKTLMRAAMEGVELAFARDELSRKHLAAIVDDPSKVRLAPDFTNLVVGAPPNSSDYAERVCVIPNARMVDKTSSDTAAAYPGFLVGAMRTLRELGKDSFLLVHEGPKDEALAEGIAKAVGSVEIVRESDPLRIKGIIGASYATVGSRFHGLVSSLSQGVPCVGTGWSHKYAALFADYGVEDMIVDVRSDASRHREMLARLADGGERDRISRGLIVASNRFKEQAREMWAQVFGSIEPRARLGS